MDSPAFQAKRAAEVHEDSDFIALAVVQRDDTLPKFSMEPKKDGFQKKSPIQGCHI